MNKIIEPTVSLKIEKMDSEASPPAPGLRGLFQWDQNNFGLVSRLCGLTDPRASNSSIPFGNIMASLFCMTLLQYPSMDAFFSAPLSTTRSLQNCCTSVIKSDNTVKNAVPHRSTAERVLGNLKTDEIQTVLSDMADWAHESGLLRANTTDGYVIMPVDGTETYNSMLKQCDGRCQHRDHQDGRTEYLHRAVAASVVVGGVSMIVDFEMMGPTDSTKKGESELTAGTRLVERIGKNHPGMVDIVTADALYPNQTFINAVLKADAEAVIRIKGDQRKIVADAKRLFDNRKGRCKTFFAQTRKGDLVLVIAHWADGLKMTGINALCAPYA